jgi:hypothetical protein
LPNVLLREAVIPYLLRTPLGIRVACGILPLLCGTAAGESAIQWVEPNNTTLLPARAEHDNASGKLGVLNADAVDMRDHPFFTALGRNGRACVSCHQPAYGMSVSAEALRERWRATQGKDPVFAAFDGSNCPNLPQQLAASHSLLLQRGLFRIVRPWPPQDELGHSIAPEFALEVVRDATGCNTSGQYGLNAKQPNVSVFRRPRPAANLKYAIANERASLLVAKNGLPAAANAVDTPAALNIVADARHATLHAQALDALQTHLQITTPLDAQRLQRLVDFELQIYAAQSRHVLGGALAAPGSLLGPEALLRGQPGLPGNNLQTPLFGDLTAWQSAAADTAQREFRASALRGYGVFFLRTFFIRDAMHFNTQGIGNPAKRTCAGCHAMQGTGMELAAGWIDSGTTNSPWADDAPELPLFKVTCDADLPPHAFLGRTIYTHDPGRALSTGKCNDVGAIVMQQLRGLAARPPYFANGAASTLREVVDFYDRRFNIRFTEQDKQDLVNFLSTL